MGFGCGLVERKRKLAARQRSETKPFTSMEIDKYTLESIHRLIEYVYDDECKDWEASQTDDHIFKDIQVIAGWLDKVR